jgi:class 3 adenylate cyclase
MAAEPANAAAQPDLAFEIAHVLFLDIVAYSRLPMENQAAVLGKLQSQVLHTSAFVRAQKTESLISLPTGDGMALVFFHDAEAPVRCAVELTEALRSQAGPGVRMGIHSGPVYRVADINANRNVAGGGINLAQRVMDCGDAGHILVSKSTADVLDHFAAWNGTLHDLGEMEVKHGVRIHVFNLYTAEVGNPELPQRLRAAQKATARMRRKRAMFVAAGALALSLAMTGFLYWRRSHTLTARDTIVLADFINDTGDAVFDDALKQGLSVELEQSPFLNILSDDRVRQQLRYMGHSADDRLTPQLALEVCKREASKVMLLGSISKLGSHYVIGLKTVNCSNGDSLGKEQAEAERREDVLNKLHEAGTRLRTRLGESLASVQKFDTPLERATTSSLEALQAYSMASKIWRYKQDAAAVPLYQHAVDLDPDFAMAYADLGVMYAGLNEAGLSAEYAKKAYELRDRVTELEKFSIDWTYYQYVTGDLEKAAQVCEAWKQTYPRALAPYLNLGLIDSYLGQLDQALAHDLQGMQVRADTARVYSNLSGDYFNLGRVNDAATVLKQARAKKLDESLLPNFYQLAFLENDDLEMARAVEAAKGTGDEDELLSSQADTEAYYGRLTRARELSRAAIAVALGAGAKETAAGWQATAALREAEFGNFSQAKQEALAALTLGPSRDVRIAVSMALARSGDSARAQNMVDELYKQFPENTLMVNYWLPSIRAAIGLQRNNAPLAIGYLQVTAAYELGGATPPFSAGATLYPTYLRGEAYLSKHQWNEAVAEFEKIRAHRGLVWNFPTGSLAVLHLARAYVGTGDTTKAKAQYQEFLALWKNADSDNPNLRDAKSEYARLR